MNLEKLHQIVQELGRDEKKLITKSLSTGQGKKNKYGILFEALSKAKDWTENDEQKLRRKGFQRPDSMYQAKEILLERIVGVLSKNETGYRSRLDQVRTAYNIGAFDHGAKVLKHELQKAQSEQRLLYMLELYDFAGTMKDHYRILIPLPEEVMSEAVVRVRYDWRVRMKHLILTMRDQRNEVRATRLHLADEVLMEIKSAPAHIREAEIDFNRAEVRALILKNDFNKAIAIQNEICKRVSDETGSFISRLNEGELLMRLYMDSGAKQKAIQALFEIRTLPTQNQLDAQLLEKCMFQNTIFIASYNYDEGFIANAIEMVGSTIELYQPERQVLYLYTLAILSFYTSNFEAARNLIQQIDTYSRKVTNFLEWQISTLRLLTHIETGEFEILESLMRSTTRVVAKYDIGYPRAICRVAKQQSGHGNTTGAHNDMLTHLQELSSNPQEREAMDYFNLKAYLISKEQNIPMKEVLLSLQQEENSQTSISVA